MSEPENRSDDRLDPEELEVEAELLPSRELPSLIDSNVVIPVNAAVAANVLSEDAIAIADAQQDVDVEQTSDDDNT